MSAGRSKLLLFLLLFLPHNSQAEDGCQGEYGHLYWRCGDVCTAAYAPEQNCTCGGETFSPNDGKWCCGTNCTGGCLERKQGYKDGDHPLYCVEWSLAICTNGVALPLNESCNGVCNYHPEDKYRDTRGISRSHVASHQHLRQRGGGEH